MLVLSREKGQVVVIGDKVRVKVHDIRGNKVRLSFDAPENVEIWREEVYDKIQEAKRAKEG